MNDRIVLIERITDYLAKGGLFNPEMMDSEKVQRLLMDCRDYLMQRVEFIPPSLPTNSYPINNCSKCGIKLDRVMGYVCYQSGCPTGLGGVKC